MMKRLLAMSLVFAMLLTALAGCGSSAAPPPVSQPPPVTTPPASTSNNQAASPGAGQAAAAGNRDNLDYVELSFLFIGDAPPDTQLVEDALNKLLMEKFNCKLNIRHTTWTNWNQKYEAELLAESVDLIMSATWMNYGTYATQLAYLELDDLLPVWAPELYAAADGRIERCRVDGKIYMVPMLWDEYVSTAVYFREDLRKKYDLPVPSNIDDAYAYLKGIKDQEPERTILRVIPSNPGVGTFSTRYSAIFDMKYDRIMARYGLFHDYKAPRVPIDYWFSDEFVEDCKMLKKWCDDGLWSKSTLSDNVPTAYTVENDLAVAIFGGDGVAIHYTNALRNITAAGTDMELGFAVFGEENEHISVFPVHPAQNGTSLARTTKNPERALMVLEYIMMDYEAHSLVHYGIEGVHYALVDGVYTLLSDAATPPFKYEGFQSWGLRNTELMLRDREALIMKDIFERLEAISKKQKYPVTNIDGGFFEDFSSYATERAALMNVVVEHLQPLQSGVVDDVDSAVAAFRKAAVDAGLYTIRETFQKNWAAYLEANGFE